MLYLHEIIDIIGTGQEEYLNTVIERARHSEGEGISRLVGTWKVIGSTNRWPRVVNLWEMDGWSEWAESLERQHLPEKKDAALAPWWAKATAWRSGGFDRILEPAPYSPTLDELRRRAFKAWVCVHSIVRARSGRRADLLRAVGERLQPLLESEGLIPMGAYSVPMLSDEIVLLTAAPDFRHLCKLHDERQRHPEWRRWVTDSAALWQGYETMWLVPSAGCFFHPLNVAIASRP
jgi:hypothetical protein